MRKFMSGSHFPTMLSKGANNIVIALSNEEAAKLFHPDQEAELEREVENIRFANSINELVVRFLRVEHDPERGDLLLVMERLFPVDFRAYEVNRRQLWMDVFEHELRQLHRAGFVHRDLLRMPRRPGMTFDNILLTENGLRLIDAGISCLRQRTPERLFQLMVLKEMDELNQFKRFFLNR